MNNSPINRDHIVALKEEDGKFSNVNIPIEKPAQFIAELNAMADNPDSSILDMQSLFQSRYPKEREYLDYIYPKPYSATYVSGTKYPEVTEKEELENSWSEAGQEASARYAQQCADKGVHQDKTHLSSLIEDAIAELKLEQKQIFLTDALEWIDAYSYNEMANRINCDSSIKMYSKENIGWHTFRHDINKDIKIELQTNFGFGSAAYFLLGVKYKDIAILPYSHIVRYYKANMADIIKCTCKYELSRDSWGAAFDYLSEFINDSIEDPDSFIKSHVMNEVEEMMQGLEAIASNPQAYIDKIAYNTAEPCVISVRHMFSDDRKQMSAYPSETSILFKVDKINGALEFLDSLTEISHEVSEVKKHINRLIELNMALMPEIEDALKKVTKLLEEKNREKELLDSKNAELSEKLKPYVEEIRRLRAALSEGEKFNLYEYENTHPEYVTLTDEKERLFSQLMELSRTIRDLTSFEEILQQSLKRVSKVKELVTAA